MSRATPFRSLLGFLAAACFLVFLIGQAPHLVHHLFEPAHGQTDCAFASGADRTQGLVSGCTTLPSVLPLVARELAAVHPLLLAAAPADFEARAPPFLLS